MFGGLSFMVRGKLALSATGLGDLLVRCDPERVNDLLDAPGSEWAEMNGRRMARGWIRVGPAGIESEEQFEGWIEAALDYSERITTARDS